MESDGENLDNIFEDYEAAENDNAADNTENVQTENDTSKVKVPVPKRIVKNPRLKFNPERLCGERGIPVLVDHFKDVKFKGPGYEREDLDKLMSRLEHWTHRLFPSMKFEDCLNQIEKLGKKRPVQTCLRKIRLDMPLLDRDFIHGDEEDDNVQRNDDPDPVESDAFDRLVQESQDVISNTSATENVFSYNSFYSSPALNNSSIGHVLGTSNESSLSEEQKQRMERNRMLAAERRKARLAAVEQNSLDLQPASQKDDFSQNSLRGESSFDTLFGNSENSQTIKNRNNSMDDVQGDIGMSTSKMDTENSENLGLEDLIDLVDEEPVFEKKNSENLGLEDLIDLVDDEEPVLEKKNSENLGLEDLIDLVDDEEPVLEKGTTLSDSSLTKNSHVLSVDEEMSLIEKESTLTDDVCESDVLVIDETEPALERQSTFPDDVCESDVLVIDETEPVVGKESTLSDDMYESDALVIDETEPAV